VKPGGPKRRPARPAWAKLAAVAAAFFALFLVWRYTPLADVLTVELVLTLSRGIGASFWSPLLVVAFYTPAAFVLFPRPLITLFAAIAYGPWLGFAVAMTGIMLSAVAVYYAGRALPKETLRKWAGERVERATKAMRGHGFLASLAASIAPVAPFPVIGMVAGAARIKLWHYLAGTALGMLPGTIATTVFADQLATAMEDPSKINYWVVAAVIAFFVAVTVLARRWLLRLQARRAPA
jgi:uncharacterized membrane protein YdjX (TVP38/TMEM64 family)